MDSRNYYTLIANFDPALSDIVDKDMKFYNLAGEVDPSSDLGIERGSLVAFEEARHSVPIFTIDKNNAKIGPRKRPQ